MPTAIVLSCFPIVRVSFEHQIRFFRDIMFWYAEFCMVKKKIRRKTLAQHAKDHFVPHKGNGYHPHVLKHHVLLGYSAIAVLLKSLVIAVAVVYPHIDLLASAISPQNIINLTNQARAAVGLPALHPNEKLAASAHAKALDMLQKQYFAHTSPEGLSPWYWIGRSGYDYIKSGENLAVHFAQAEDVQAGWIASPDHKKQLLHPEFVDVGVGVVEGQFEGKQTYFVAEHFGEPELAIPVAPNIVQAQKPSPPIIPEPVPSAAPLVIVKPASAGVTVNVSDKHAASMSATIGQAPVRLQKQDAETWTGTVTAKELGDQPKTLTVTSKEKISAKTESASVLIGMNSSPMMLYGQQTAQVAQGRLFDLFTADQVASIANIFFLFIVVALLGSVLVYLFTKMHTPKRLVIGHALSVIGLIVILSVV